MTNLIKVFLALRMNDDFIKPFKKLRIKQDPSLYITILDILKLCNNYIGESNKIFFKTPMESNTKNKSKK